MPEERAKQIIAENAVLDSFAAGAAASLWARLERNVVDASMQACGVIDEVPQARDCASLRERHLPGINRYETDAHEPCPAYHFGNGKSDCFKRDLLRHGRATIPTSERTVAVTVPAHRNHERLRVITTIFHRKGDLDALNRLFTPLEETRVAAQRGSKLPDLTDLQWEFFFTCRALQSGFLRHNRAVTRFMLGTPLYYYLLGRRLFGSKIKYPLCRFTHVLEWFLKRRLYLNLNEPSSLFRVPETVTPPASTE